MRVIRENKWLVGCVAAACIVAVSSFEGKENWPYVDVGGVKTVCYGHTGPDIEDRAYSDAECETMLQKDLVKHANSALECVRVPINQNQHAALTSWAYNVGTGAACRSSAMKKLNAGDYIGFCNGLLAWNKVNGKEYRGLIRRRQSERALCLSPVA